MKQEIECREGPEARDNFEQAMKALFQTPKVASAKKRDNDKPATLRKSKDADND